MLQFRTGARPGTALGLVIEDESEMCRNWLTILCLENFAPLAAENGRVGIDLALAERPDLIRCDVMMPELDGHGVLRAMRADVRTSAIPFIFLTARGEKVDIRSGMNLGADDYLTKHGIVLPSQLCLMKVRGLS